MRIATWNINSVRLRIENVKKLLKEQNLDMLCLQETKTEDQFFPAEALKAAGYNHLHYSGQKSYNGVAIISRIPCELDNTLSFYNNDKRHISVKFTHNKKTIELHNLYVPAGGDIPDEKLNDKFLHKLSFKKEITKWYGENRKDKNIIVVGDFNIAPFEHDVWSHKQLLKIVSHTPIEVEHLNDFRKSLGFIDIAREFIPHEEKLYSWWSYRNKDWRKSDRGRRLDHIWTTPQLAKSVKSFEIIKDARDWPLPSDHVPVIIEL